MDASSTKPNLHDWRRLNPELCQKILESAGRGMPRLDFLGDVSRMVLEYGGFAAVEIRIIERGRLWRCVASADPENPTKQEVVVGKPSPGGSVIPVLETPSCLEQLCEGVVLGRTDRTLPFVTEKGSVWLEDTAKPPPWCDPDVGKALTQDQAFVQSRGGSLAIIGFSVARNDNGLLLLESSERGRIDRESTESYEHVAEVLGISLAQRRTHLALRERVKELTCLNDLAKVAARPEASLDDIMTSAVEILRRAWIYEDIATVEIELDDRSYSTEGFAEKPQMLVSEIIVKGEKRGLLRVAYTEAKPELDEGPFVSEERNLLDVVAREMALIVEARNIDREKETLREQLRHADRLATIGQLAAGVAHELNEPLASILGRAQLTTKVEALPDQVKRDNDKIITAALHAREIISKLRLLARHAPPHREKVILNDVVQEGLDLVESRCAKNGIVLAKELDPELPEITADAGQLYQVLINLVVNAMQATPPGGLITIRTSAQDGGVHLVVEDTGVGIRKDALKRIFTPFFTTKEVDEGTGLGLAVVEGIVRSHGGEVAVDSKEGEGSRFAIKLPLHAAGSEEEVDDGSE